MRWQEGGESENVEDQRGLPVGMALGGAGTVIVVVLGLLLGENPLDLLQQVQGQAGPPDVRARGRIVPKRPARSRSSSTSCSRPSRSGPTSFKRKSPRGRFIANRSWCSSRAE